MPLLIRRKLADPSRVIVADEELALVARIDRFVAVQAVAIEARLGNVFSVHLRASSRKFSASDSRENFWCVQPGERVFGLASAQEW